MSSKALSDFIHITKYANYVHEHNRRETREESSQRMFDMHRRRYPHIKNIIDRCQEDFDKGLILGSQRALQFGGEAMEKQNARGFNCTASYCDRSRFFQETLWLMLCGCGVGFSVQRHHVAKLPDIARPLGNGSTRTFVIPDTIEGWADAAGELIDSYFHPEKGAVAFDYTLIRPEGSPISSSNGKAPGPEPLRQSLEQVRALLDRRCQVATRLRPIDAYDMTMHLSDAVLAGGVRRSSAICLFSADDEEMSQAKTGTWFRDNPQRARSNNSALLIRNHTKRQDFDRLIECAKTSGDPGFYWADDTEFVTNPCQPASAPVITKDGLRTFADIDAGSEIWSETGWTKVVKKWATGTKPVYRYRTTAGYFIGTENHRLVCDGEKIEARYAHAIDTLAGPAADCMSHDKQAVVDGLLIGDGTVHKAGGGVLLVVGKKDGCYFESEIADFFTQRGYGGREEYCRIQGTIRAEELPYTYQRRVPERFLSGDVRTTASFLRGLYSANGSVVLNRVTLKTSSASLRDDVQLMLSGLGIRSYYTTNRSHKVQFANGEYECRESYDINISSDAKIFQHLIGFVHPYKNEKLSEAVSWYESGRQKQPKPKTNFDIIDTEYLGDEEVFDITVDNDTHTYWTGGVNVSNCCEVAFYPVWKGQTGFGFCNLTTINAEACKTAEDFMKAAASASILGTLQAGYTDFPYLGPVSEAIAREEALLGVSITGIMRNPKLIFNPEVLEQAAKRVLEANEDTARLIGINPCARGTANKPEGTGSLFLDTSCGLTPDHAHRTMRQVQVNRNEAPYRHFRTYNPGAVEKSVWSTGGTDDVITFCIEAPEGALVKKDVEALDMLKKVKMLKEHWVNPGRRTERCLHPSLSHNVSNTIHIAHKDEWKQAADYIFEHQNTFAGVTLVSSSIDLDLKQVPYIAVKTVNEILETYGRAAIAATVYIDMALAAFDDDLWAACDTALGCPMGFGVQEPNKTQEMWIKNFQRMAHDHMDGDLKKATYCLKDVYLIKKWDRLMNEYRDVDYTTMFEAKNVVDFGQMPACAGGVCELG